MKAKVKSKKAKILAVFMIAMLSLAGCERPEVNTASEPSQVPMRAVTDDLERTVLVPSKVTRVISTAPSVTEMIFAAGGGDRLVGVTTFCDFPEEAKQIAKIGDTMNPNMESIIALRPDVVFVSTASQIEAFTRTLEQNGIAVYVMNPAFFDQVLLNLRQLGIIFGTTDRTEKLITELQDRERKIHRTLGIPVRSDETPAEIDRRVGAIKVFVQISKEPLFTIGEDAFLNDLLLSAGGRSVTENVASAFPKLSKETASALNPEAIILSDSADNKEPNDAFKSSPAVKNGRVYRINPDIISRPGPRLVDALEQIARDLHPEKFN